MRRFVVRSFLCFGQRATCESVRSSRQSVGRRRAATVEPGLLQAFMAVFRSVLHDADLGIGVLAMGGRQANLGQPALGRCPRLLPHPAQPMPSLTRPWCGMVPAFPPDHHGPQSAALHASCDASLRLSSSLCPLRPVGLSGESRRTAFSRLKSSFHGSDAVLSASRVHMRQHLHGFRPGDAESSCITEAEVEQLVQQCLHDAVDLQAWICVNSSPSQIRKDRRNL